MRNVLIGSLAVVIGCASAPAPGEEAAVDSTKDALYVETGKLFPIGKRTIDVCFTSAAGSSSASVAELHAALSNTWEKESAVAFRIEPYCFAWFASTHVHVAPWRGASADWWDCGLDIQQGDGAFNNGRVGTALIGSPNDLPICHVPQTDRLTARGFGFILGFHEELKRPWPDQLCWNGGSLPLVQNGVGLQTVGPYDIDSVMNRCGVFSTAPLSPSDIDGVQRFYGAPQPLAVQSLLSSFFRGGDNHLWQSWYSASGWTWVDHGNALGGVPAVITRGAETHVFMRGSDGRLIERYYAGGWSWYTHPTGIIKGGPAAITGADGSMRVFVRGTDNRIYERRFDGAGWLPFTPIGGSITTDSDPAVVSPAPDRYSVFFETDAVLMEHKWDGTAWSTVTHSGRAVRGPVRATVVPNTNGDIVVFMKGADDTLIERRQVSGPWYWADHGGVLRGVPSVEDPTSIWIRGSDDRLYQRWYNGANWQWIYHGNLPITSSPTAVPNMHRVVVRNEKGGVSERFWTGTAWAWEDRPMGPILP